MAAACRTEGCTVGDTDVCLLDNDPATCEFRIRGLIEGEEGEETALAAPVLDSPEERPTLWGSLPLELSDLRDLMASRQSLLVGVLGTPAAGKTAALVSMYLLVSHGNLEGFQFAESRTLLAFEEISQGARRWGTARPEEMTARTESKGDRIVGFLHARLKRLSDGSSVNLFIPDLPGEWSDTLIDSNRVDRLDFIRAANVIWVFVNGAELRSADMRMLTLNRTNLLLRRLASLLKLDRPPVKVVVSHADAGTLSEPTARRLKSMCENAGLDAEIIDIASFSESDDVAPGHGIAELIKASLPVRSAPPPGWPEGAPPTAGRFMLRYKRERPA